nr:hypothetical protein GCM10025732_19450 [Glycomyces mayteni]
MRMPRDEAEAVAMQTELAGCVVVADDDRPIDTVAGLDIAYDTASDTAVATAVVLRRGDLAVLDEAVVQGASDFPYVPGLLAFRELPLLLKAIEALTVAPDLYVCDGYGLTHPRRFGLACHLGVVLDAPAIGVAKNPPHLPVADPGPARGDWSPIDAGRRPSGARCAPATASSPCSCPWATAAPSPRPATSSSNSRPATASPNPSEPRTSWAASDSPRRGRAHPTPDRPARRIAAGGLSP